MNTADKNAAAVQGAAKAGEAANRTQNRPSLTGKEAKQDGKDETSATNKAAQPEAAKASETKTGNAPAVADQPADAAEQSAQALTAGEAGEKAAPKKFALNLEQTLRSVNDLHRLSIQRLALIARIKLLEEFEVKLVEESDELADNPYQGCKLIIQDDRRREFVTNTPNLIRMVSQFIFDACYDKLAEIESNIVFPNA